MYDYVIIGGGIAGLYTAYRLLSKTPVRIVILEKENQIGGRAKTEVFYGVNIVSGAGIGRKRKDKLLLKLMHKLRIPVRFYTVKKDYVGFKSIDIMQIMNQLKTEYKKNQVDKARLSFKKFAIQKIGVKKYNRFILTSGYRDYENENVWNTLYKYGMDDNTDNWKAFSVSWSLIENKLANYIGNRRIKLNHKVINISGSEEIGFEVKTNNNKIFKTKKVIIASTINTVQKLVKNKKLKFQPILDNIKSQPFTRIYGKFSLESAEIINRYLSFFTMVKSPLQKIIPMDKEKGVYMICYNDNKNAEMLKSRMKNSLKNRIYLCKLFRDALGIKEKLELIAIRGYYWKEGTHYYEKKPISFREMSDDGITVVGEMISMNQGWVEGALESVEKVIENL